MWYSVDFFKLLMDWTLTFLRLPLVKAFASPTSTAIDKTYNEWSTMRNDNLYKLAHNGQVVYLQQALNDSFDPVLRRIQIVDGNRFGRLYIYTGGEQKPLFLGKTYLRPSTDFADTGVDFIVLVPAGLQFNNFDMTALIDFYRLASKRYTIQSL